MSANQRELGRQRRSVRDQFTAQKQAERAVAEQAGVRRADVETREIGRRPSVKEQALRKRAASTTDAFNPSDFFIKDSGRRLQPIIKPESIKREREETESEFRRRVADKAGPDFTESDVVISHTSGGQIEASISERAVKRERQEQRQQLREKVAGESDLLTPQEVAVSREDGTITATPKPDALRESIKRQVAKDDPLVDRDEVQVDLSGEEPNVTVRGEDQPTEIPEDADLSGADVEISTTGASEKTIRNVAQQRQKALANAAGAFTPGTDVQDIREGDFGDNPGLKAAQIAVNLGVLEHYQGGGGVRESPSQAYIDFAGKRSDALTTEQFQEAGQVATLNIGGVRGVGRTLPEARKAVAENILEKSKAELGAAAFDPRRTGSADVQLDFSGERKLAAKERVLEQAPESVEAKDVDVNIDDGRAETSISDSARADIRESRQERRQELRRDVAREAGEGITASDVDVREQDGQLTGRVEIDALQRQVAEQAGPEYAPTDVTVQTGDQGTRAFISDTAVEREQQELKREVAVEAGQRVGPSDIVAGQTDEGRRLSVMEEVAREVAAERTIAETARQVEGVGREDLSPEDVTFVEQDGDQLARVRQSALEEEMPQRQVRRTASPDIGPRAVDDSTTATQERRETELDGRIEPVASAVDDAVPFTQGDVVQNVEESLARDAQAHREGRGALPTPDQAESFVEDSPIPEYAALVASPITAEAAAVNALRGSDDPVDDAVGGFETLISGQAKRAAEIANPAGVALSVGKMAESGGEFTFNVAGSAVPGEVSEFGDVSRERASAQASTAASVVGNLATESVASAKARPIETAGSAQVEVGAALTGAAFSPVRVSRVDIPTRAASGTGRLSRVRSVVGHGGESTTTVRGARLRTPFALEKAGVRPRSSRTLVGSRGGRPTMGAPEVKLSTVDFSRSAERTAAIEAGRQLETEVIGKSVKSQLDPEQAARFQTARELTGVGERVGGSLDLKTTEEIAQEVRAVPESKSGEIGKLLKEHDATIKGSASVRAQISEARQPRDLDIAVEDEAAFRRSARDVLEDESAKVRDIFDFADASEFPRQGESLKFGRRVPRRPTTAGGVTLTSAGEELTRKAGASAFVRGRGTAGTADIDVGPEPVRPGKPVRGKDPADAVTIGRSVTRPGSRARRQVEEFADLFESDISAAADTNVMVGRGAPAGGRGTFDVTIVDDLPNVQGAITRGGAARGQMDLALGGRGRTDLDLSDETQSVARRSDTESPGSSRVAESDQPTRPRSTSPDSGSAGSSARALPVTTPAASPSPSNQRGRERSTQPTVSPVEERSPPATGGASDPTSTPASTTPEADTPTTPPTSPEPDRPESREITSPGVRAPDADSPSLTGPPTGSPGQSPPDSPGEIGPPGSPPANTPTSSPPPGRGSPPGEPPTSPPGRRGQERSSPEQASVDVESEFTKEFGGGVAEEEVVLEGDVEALGDEESFSEGFETSISETDPTITDVEGDLSDIDL